MGYVVFFFKKNQYSQCVILLLVKETLITIPKHISLLVASSTDKQRIYVNTQIKSSKHTKKQFCQSVCNYM